MHQRPGQRSANGKTLHGRQACVSGAHFPKRLGNVFLRRKILCAVRVIREFHHVVEVSGGFVSADVEDRDLIFLLAGQRLEPLNARELALERPRVLEAGAINNFDGAINPRHATGKPDFAVSTTSDGAQRFVVRNDGSCTGHTDVVAEKSRR